MYKVLIPSSVFPKGRNLMETKYNKINLNKTPSLWEGWDGNELRNTK